MNNVKLGDLARDRITGFSGIVTAETTWLNGCQRISLQPRDLDKDGKVRDALTFDIEQIEVLEAGVVKPQAQEIKSERTRESGGPMPDVTRARDPQR